MSWADRYALVIPQMLTEKRSNLRLWAFFYCLTMYSIKSVICFSFQPILRRYSIIRLMALSLKDSIPCPFTYQNEYSAFQPREQLAPPGVCCRTLSDCNLARCFIEKHQLNERYNRERTAPHKEKHRRRCFCGYRSSYQ